MEHKINQPRKIIVFNLHKYMFVNEIIINSTSYCCFILLIFIKIRIKKLLLSTFYLYEYSYVFLTLNNNKSL